MSITASTVYRDTMNFTRHQLVSVLLMSLLTALIMVILNHALMPGADQLQILSNAGDLSPSASQSFHDFIQQMTPEQQGVLLKFAAAGAFASLVNSTLLIGGVLLLVQLVSAGHRTSALRAIGASAPLLPRLFFLILLNTLLIQLGLLLFIVPGFFLAIAVSLSPVIAAVENRGVFASLKTSAKLAYANIKLIAPAIMFWLIAKIALLLLVSRLPFASPMVMAVIVNGISNMISAVVLIYLFRLYMLLRPEVVSMPPGSTER